MIDSMRRLLLATAALGLGVAIAQRGTGEWMTSGFDAQRSNWVRGDGKISLATMSKPGFDLAWKVKPTNTARQFNTTTPPSLLDFYISYRGFRTLGFWGASSDRVISYDLDMSRIEWEKSYPVTNSANTPACPGGMTSAVTRPTGVAYPGAFAARGAGRGTPARTDVGEPNEGAALLKTRAAARPAPPPPPKPAAPKANAAAAADNPFAPRIQYAVALTGDGKLRMLWVSNGNETKPAGVPFLPPGANAHGLIVVDGYAYVGTSNGCNGVDNAVWALDVASGKVNKWKAGGNGVAGNQGPAFGPDGTVYVATTDGELAALENKTLAPLASTKLAGAQFTSSPTVFPYQGKDMIAVAVADGTIAVFDAANLAAGPVARSKPYTAANYATGALSTWQDAAGTRWILAPSGGKAVNNAGFQLADGEVTNGSLAALKLIDRDGKPAFQNGWASRDLTGPSTPIVVNGVVFALSTGFKGSVSASQPATLYALDPFSGKVLWSSGKTMTSFSYSGGLSSGGGRVYTATHDGVIYAFAFPMEL